MIKYSTACASQFTKLYKMLIVIVFSSKDINVDLSGIQRNIEKHAMCHEHYAADGLVPFC